MKRFAPSLLLVAVGFAAAACGIPISSGPNALPRAALPQPLVQPQPAPSPGEVPTKGGAGVVIYLVQDISGDLVGVPRTVTRPATVQQILNQLEFGPLGTEYRVGDESAINASSHLVAENRGAVRPCTNKKKRAPACGMTVVRLDRYFSQLQGEAPVQELGQIVWSLTASQLGVTEVRFVGPSGLPISIETDTGRFVDRPVTACDYGDLVPTSKC